MNQLLCHNEFTIVGRIDGKIQKINNDTIRVLIICPNDDNYELDANKVYVDFDFNDMDKFSNMIGEAVAVTGHIEFNSGITLKSEMYQFIN